MRSPLRTTRKSVLTAAALAVAVPVGVGLSAGAAQAASPPNPTGTTTACWPGGSAPVPGQPTAPFGTVSAPAPAAGVPAPATIATSTIAPVTEATLRQTYLCLSDHYYGANPRTDRVLLVGAYAGLLQELDHLGRARVAAPPAFAADRGVDWNAFRTVLQRAADGPGDTAAVRQRLGIAALNGMAASVRDKRAPSTYGEALAGHAPSGLTAGTYRAPDVTAPAGPGAGAQAGGLTVTRPASLAVRGGQEAGGTIVTGPDGGASGPVVGAVPADGAEQVLGFRATRTRDGAMAELTLAEVRGGPAAAAGLQAGDVIESIDGRASISNGAPDRDVLDRLLPPESGKRTVRLVVRRPSTGRTWTVNLTQAAPDPAAGGGPRIQRFLSPDGPGQVPSDLPPLAAPGEAKPPVLGS
ncbi:PDZ domain-containing protein [Frankia sp. AgB32]|uniref:PDZ domain-containing protein n=1 Tax=Frankia sp. AgB32 TaxID=631119 RepID=UPI00200CF5C1|nr:PDZ domain-containing protein [Frankia sp. AgB32]MCK9895474.1 PDZ domain-containing protein [Frankia sp. AgB32]